MEAGVEHLSRTTTRHSDVMLIVTEPYYRSLETAARIHQMAGELNIPNVFTIANKVRTQKEADAISTFSQKRGLQILATVPFDTDVADSSLVPEAPVDYCPDSDGVQAIGKLVSKLKKDFMA